MPGLGLLALPLPLAFAFGGPRSGRSRRVVLLQWNNYCSSDISLQTYSKPYKINLI